MMKGYRVCMTALIFLSMAAAPVQAVAKPALDRQTAMDRLDRLEDRRQTEEMRLQMGLGLTDELLNAYQQLEKDYTSDPDFTGWIEYRLAEGDYSRDRFDDAARRLKKLRSKKIGAELDTQAGFFQADVKKSPFNPKRNDHEALSTVLELEVKHPDSDHVKIGAALRKADELKKNGVPKAAREQLANQLKGKAFPAAKDRQSGAAETPWEKETKRKYAEELAKAKREAAFSLAAEGNYSQAYEELTRLAQEYSGDNPFDYFTFTTRKEDLAYQQALALAAAGRKQEATLQLQQFMKAFPDSYLSIRAQERIDEWSPKSASVSDPAAAPTGTSANQTQTAASPASPAAPKENPESCICGPSALKAALSELGRQTDLNQLIKLAGTTDKGTTMNSLVLASRQEGVNAVGIRAPAAALSKLKLPAVLLLQDHYVTVTSAAGDNMTVYDPSIGWITQPVSQLAALWTGNAIVFVSTDALAVHGISGAATLTDEQMKKLTGKYTCSNAGGFGGVPGGPECNQPCANFQAGRPEADGDLDGMLTSINRVYGNLAIQTPDLVYQGAEGNHTNLKLYFNSTASDSKASAAGPRWSLTYSDRMVPSSSNPGNLDLETGDGSRLTFTRNIDGTFTSPPNNFDVVTQNPDKTITLVKKDQTRLEFDINGSLVRKIDRLGQGVTLGYDGQNRLTSLTDSNGMVTTLNYGSNGYISSIDANGQYQVKLSYDGSNRLKNITYPDSQAYNFDYASGFAITDRKGETTKFAYVNSGGQISSRTNPDGRRMDINAANPTGGSMINYAGISTSYTWDSRYIVTGVKDELGHLTGYSYTADNKVAATTDPLGNKTKNYYDTRGNKTTVEDALGNKTNYVYSDKNELLAVIDALGRKTSYAYDDKGNLISVTNAMGYVMTYSYNDKGLLTALTDYAGALTRYSYDSAGRITAIEDALHNKTLYEYDPLGRRIAEVDPAAYRTEYTYDVFGHITRITYPDRSTRSMTYSGDNLTSETDGNGNTATYQYDKLGRLTKVTDPAGAATVYQYDVMGNVVSVQDANGAVTTRAYDVKNRLTGIVYPGGAAESYSYDSNDRLAVKVEAEGTTVTYTYDALNRLIKTERK